MTHEFDKDYWDQHWQRVHGEDREPLAMPANPYLARELADLTPGTALDAGCGEGAEAIWLATAGWRVTAVDIAAGALETAAARDAASGVSEPIDWVEADLSAWAPPAAFDLVTTHYAHPSIPQLDFYDRIAGWVAPGGTLLIVGHLHGEHGHGHAHGDDDQPPAEASATAATITARLDRAQWDVVTAEEGERSVARPGGHAVTLHDVVVRAVRSA